MRIFNELVLDTFCESGTEQVSKTYWQAVMGNIDAFRLIAVVDRISGSSPTLWLALGDTPDMGHFQMPPAAKVLLNNVPLTAGQTNTFQVSLAESDAIPMSYGAALLYILGGTSQKAHLRVWATGRGRA